MAESVVRVLHVEDDATQHKVLMVRLRSAGDLKFEPTWVTGEAEALAAHAPGKFDLVIVDYNLEQGDGLHLLRELRARDPVVPVIAMSGAAPSMVALDIIRAGADEYFDKSDLDTRRLVKCIRDALARVKDRQTRHATPEDVAAAICELCRDFGARLGAEFVERLARVEALAREARVSERAFDALHARALDSVRGDEKSVLARFVRFEIGARLFQQDVPAERTPVPVRAER